MNLGELTDHIVMYYPILGRYIVFYKEGGAQTMDMELDQLPNSLRKYIKECEERGWCESLTTGIAPCVAHPNKAFTVKVYSKSYADVSG